MAVEPRHQPKSFRGGFTLTELMVSIAILVVVMLAVSYIFSAVSKTTGLTTANIELTDTLDILRRTMQDDLNAMAPGLLIIDSPDPLNLNGAEPTHIPDALGEPFDDTDPNYAPRRDRLVLLTGTSPGTYQSWFYPDISTGEAAIHYGHGGVWGGDTVPVHLPALAFDRVLVRRVVLLGADGAATAVYPLGWPPPGSELLVMFRLHICAFDAVQETLSDLLVRLRGFPATLALQPLYIRSLAGRGFDEVPPIRINAYISTEEERVAWRNRLRHCFEMMPRVGHFIVEWTDGAPPDGPLDPEGGGMQWYGLARDLDDSGTAGEFGEPRPKGAWPPTGDYPPEEDPVSPDDYPGYRAVWRVDNGTWHLRPKALRVTVRLYDANKRVRDADERLGQPRSFILEVP